MSTPSDTPRTDEVVSAAPVYKRALDYERLENLARQLERELARKQRAIDVNCYDWASDDTEVKKIASTAIPGYDPDKQSGRYFVDVVEVAERMAAEIAELRDASRMLRDAVTEWSTQSDAGLRDTPDGREEAVTIASMEVSQKLRDALTIGKAWWWRADPAIPPLSANAEEK